jgi:hypothetical protein
MQFYNDDTTWATPSQQVEPNVGMGQRSGAVRDVREAYRYYKELFEEMMGEVLDAE